MPSDEHDEGRKSGTMAEIVGLVRSGQLGEATALILGGIGAGGLGAGGGPGMAQPVSIRTRPDDRPGSSGDDVEPGRFVWREVTADGKILRYKLYRPVSDRGTGMPLLVMLHGCTQGADDFAVGTRMNQWADRLGFIVAYPDQDRSANAQRCWNWFVPRNQARGHGEAARIAAMVDHLATTGGVDRSRVFVAGLSAGGAAAAIVGCLYPDLFAGVGVHSGLACGAARDLPSALAAMRDGSAVSNARGVLPTIAFHGTRDVTVNPKNIDRVIEQSGVTRLISDEVGHSADGTPYRRGVWTDGRIESEAWLIEGAGHAWSGGDPAGSFATETGPDASREMLRFFGLLRA